MRALRVLQAIVIVGAAPIFTGCRTPPWTLPDGGTITSDAGPRRDQAVASDMSCSCDAGTGPLVNECLCRVCGFGCIL
jgi:hypothetical protein